MSTLLDYECEWCDVKGADLFTEQGTPVCIACYFDAQDFEDKDKSKKEKTKMAGTGLDKEFRCSDELREIVKDKKMSRKKVTQALWKHIKKHKLNEKYDDGRIILCDAKLEPLFRKLVKDKRKITMKGKTIKLPKGAIFMTEIAGGISKHLS